MTGGSLSAWTDRDPGKNWGRMLLGSLALHALLLLGFLKIIPLGPGLPPLVPAYEVDLVSLGDGPPSQAPTGGEPAAAPVQPAAPAPPAKAKPVAIPKPPPPEKKIASLPEEPKALDQALERLKKKVGEENNLERSFHRLENRVKNQELLDQALTRLEKKTAGSSKSRSGTPGSGGGSEGSVTAGSPAGSTGAGLQFQIYHASLRTRIKKNWVLPEGLLKKTDLSADLLVRIARNGKIDDFRFERKSGVASFDQEVVRTLQKSDPLPPLPEGYPRGVYEVILTFHANDLGGN
jgi:colicin import membrane protein